MVSPDSGMAGHAVEALMHSFERFDRVAARAVADQYLESHPRLSFVEDVVVPALEEVGRRWENGRMALAQVYLSGRICEALVDDMLSAGDAVRRQTPRAAIAALGDQHTLGKRVVSLVVRAAGHELSDYGAEAAPEELARRAAAEGVDVLLLSALMLSSALQVQRVTREVAALGSPLRVVVGGAPFRLDPTLWRRVGAHAFGVSAFDAVRLLGEQGGAR